MDGLASVGQVSAA